MSAYIAAYIVLICFSAFFSASEMCFSSANRLRLESAAENGSKGAKVALKVMDRFDDSLSAILIGNNLVNIATSSIASVVVILLFGEHWTWLSTVITTVLVMIFGETMPKIVAKKNANRLAPVFAWPIRLLTYVLLPVILIVVGLVRLITWPLKGEERQEDEEAAVEELQSIIETAEDEDVLDENRSELLQAALDFLWTQKEVAVVLSGMSDETQVAQNLAFADASRVGKVPAADFAAYGRAKAMFDHMALVGCTGCAYCMPCPFGVQIPAVFAAYNRTVADGMKAARAAYDALDGAADRCRACRRCEQVCPQHLPIASLMTQVREKFAPQDASAT